MPGTHLALRQRSESGCSSGGVSSSSLRFIAAAAAAAIFPAPDPGAWVRGGADRPARLVLLVADVRRAIADTGREDGASAKPVALRPEPDRVDSSPSGGEGTAEEDVAVVPVVNDGLTIPETDVDEADPDEVPPPAGAKPAMSDFPETLAALRRGMTCWFFVPGSGDRSGDGGGEATAGEWGGGSEGEVMMAPEARPSVYDGMALLVLICSGDVRWSLMRFDVRCNSCVDG